MKFSDEVKQIKAKYYTPNKYEEALNELKAMVQVGGTLAEADEVISVLEELVNKYKEDEEECESCKL